MSNNLKPNEAMMALANGECISDGASVYRMNPLTGEIENYNWNVWERHRASLPLTGTFVCHEPVALKAQEALKILAGDGMLCQSRDVYRINCNGALQCKSLVDKLADWEEVAVADFNRFSRMIERKVKT